MGGVKPIYDIFCGSTFAGCDVSVTTPPIHYYPGAEEKHINCISG